MKEQRSYGYYLLTLLLVQNLYVFTVKRFKKFTFNRNICPFVTVCVKNEKRIVKLSTPHYSSILLVSVDTNSLPKFQVGNAHHNGVSVKVGMG